MFTIHSLGDGAFLYEVLNSVAMVMGHGSFEKLIMIGLLFGVLAVVVQALFKGAKEINWQQVLLGWLVYACLFVPTTRVNIDDIYTRVQRPVDNVPIGVAFAGSMISSVGYGITEMFEQGYGAVSSLTQRSYIEPLKVLNAVRSNIANDVRVIAAIDDSVGAGTDIRASLMNYVTDCTMVGVQGGVLKYDNIKNAALGNNGNAGNDSLAILNALQFNSEVYGTKIYIAGKDQFQTCRSGFAELRTVFAGMRNNAAVSGAVADAIAGIANNGAQNGFVQVQSALDLLNLNATASQDYVLTALIQPIFEKGVVNFYRVMGDTTTALMVNQAIQQRNTQWAAESTMFMSVMKPFMTFFEGFAYAITPILAFLIVTGGIGIGLGVRYIQLVMWIQLWYPVMSITNLFVTMAVREEMQSLGTVASFYALDRAGDILQNWIAVGGMLFAATPLISLFLLTGSTYAFTTLTSRMQGSDHINEKTVSPDLMTQNPFYTQDSWATGNSMNGSLRVGAQSRLSKISMREAMDNTISSLKSESESLLKQYHSNVGSSLSSARTFGEQLSIAQNYRESGSTSWQQTWDSVYSDVRHRLGDQANADQKAQVATAMVMSKLAGGLSASAGDTVSQGDSTTRTATSPVPGGGQPGAPAGQDTSQSTIQRTKSGLVGFNAGGEVGHTNQSTDSTTKTQTFTVTLGDGESVTFTDKEMASYQQAAERSKTLGDNRTWDTKSGDARTAETGRLAQEAYASQKQYAEADRLSKATSSDVSMYTNEVAAEAFRKGMDGEALSFISQFNAKDIQRKEEDLANVVSDPKTRRLTAALELAYKEHKNQGAADRFTAAVQSMDHKVNRGAETKFAGVGKEATRLTAEEKYTGPAPSFDGLGFEANAKKTEKDLKIGQTNVSDVSDTGLYGENKEKVRQAQIRNAAILRDHIYGEAYRKMAGMTDVSGGERFMASMETISKFLSSAGMWSQREEYEKWAQRSGLPQPIKDYMAIQYDRLDGGSDAYRDLLVQRQQGVYNFCRSELGLNESAAAHMTYAMCQTMHEAGKAENKDAYMAPIITVCNANKDALAAVNRSTGDLNKAIDEIGYVDAKTPNGANTTFTTNFKMETEPDKRAANWEDNYRKTLVK